ncbi:MAG: OmpA family protein [Sinobacteraceae bacterium]|nr:OmpA family protein [Nevskiaceae bacterium]
MHFRKTAAVGLAALAISAAIPAANAAQPVERTYANSPHSYIALMPGYLYVPDDHAATHNGFTASGIFGWQFAPQWEVEFNLFGSTINTHQFKPTDFYQEGLTIDLAYNLFGTDRTGFTPFVIGGVGAVYDDRYPNRYDSVNLIANAGLGFVTAPLVTHGLFDGLKLRAEARYLYDRVNTATNNSLSYVRTSIGVEIPIGTPPPTPPPPPKVITKVVHTPVPAPKIIHCPAPFPGAKLDKYGCAIGGQTVELHGVHFAFNKTTLRPDADTLLTEVSKAMKGQPSMTVEIIGNTDSIGSDAYNMKLSVGRANSVRNFLVTQGIDASRMTAVGHGEKNLLISPEKNARDRAFNRRVEFKILTK